MILVEDDFELAILQWFFLFTCDSGYIDMIYHNRLLKPTDDWNRDDSKSMILIVKAPEVEVKFWIYFFHFLCSNYLLSQWLTF